MALESSKDSDIWLPLLPNGGVLLCWKEKTLQCFRKSCENNNEENSKTYQWQCIAKATFFWPPCCVTNLQTNWRPTKNNVSGTSQEDNPVSNRIEAEHCSFCCSCGTKLTVQLYPKKLLEISVVYGNLEEHGHFSSEVFYPTFLFELPISGHWYGGAHSLRQFWPTERACLELGPYYPFDNGPQGLCGLVDPSWVSSKASRQWNIGLENFAKELLPLADSKVQGNDILHIEARRQYDLSSITHPLSNSSTFHTAYPCIDFVLGIEADVRKATERLLDYLPQCNKSKPFHALVEQPIWTTWARYKQDITQQDVENFAQEICERGYPHSVLEIDDRWSRKYGDLVFDETKFPHPEKMVQKLHDLGFLVTLWVIPFADEDSEAVLKNDASPKKYFVRQTLQNSNSNDLIASSSFRWWQPTTVKALDVTNPEACEWFLEQLYRLQREYGIDGFKFDAGEPCFLPQHPAFRETLRIPDEYTLYWNCNIASQFPIREVRAASRGCQAYVSFLRLFDKFSVWDFDNGLASIIPATLVAGIVGYPFVLPDIVGGNCYDDRQLSEELFIRWLELSLAMPSVQLSVAPWQFSEDTVKLCRELLTSRKRLLPFIDDAMEQSLNTGWPMIRPLWWTCPQLTESWTIDDEFTVGDNLLVAPVIVAHENDRDIFFPPGTWQFLPLLDSNKDNRKDYNGDIIGPCWLRQFPTPIHIVPCFRRII
ncbi:glucosidase/ hydrolase, hydrolyzing O-glycosyl compounds [Galdieria sulphuraria]|uniref:Glucosidase/ hydrolase, hydrolyzing O-glycosyl compounds n=1 Tax=Galdieria sulphuraria TaxID=130081 RepID=M2Y8W5_GALSU|nr:glucosidase/ hydrolase, hydrolyzing O-glycosyl compounds [Galdieria sulphuraria]EME32518.1 glucosidase/ hydrolase, hydrolyzing O-glycosyl compounds [Galdieria sulphuraria]|eukprot:XP_005709038.1 glucosidase/ hydrolase, hydrolyzing O-glycosyl compounds [Galdieria sulphuraria]